MYKSSTYENAGMILLRAYTIHYLGGVRLITLHVSIFVVGMPLGLCPSSERVKRGSRDATK